MAGGNEGGTGSAQSLRMKSRGSGLHKGSISEGSKWDKKKFKREIKALSRMMAF